MGKREGRVLGIFWRRRRRKEGRKREMKWIRRGKSSSSGSSNEVGGVN